MKELLPRIGKKALRSFGPLWHDFIDRRIKERIRLIPVTEVQPNDVFLVGYPKSGNTWMQHLIAGVLFGMDMRIAPDSLVQDLVPSVHSAAYYRRYLRWTFFATHDLPRSYHRRVVYLVRDGRDVMVSYYHYLKALNGAAPDYMDMVLSGKNLFPCRWHEHVEQWAANPYNAEMITISYESLKRDTVAELRRLCEFVGLERDQFLLESVSRGCSFASMREKERKLGWDERSFWPKHAAFVRRGAVGEFQNEMPAPVLEAFMNVSSAALRHFGYV